MGGIRYRPIAAAVIGLAVGASAACGGGGGAGDGAQIDATVTSQPGPAAPQPAPTQTAPTQPAGSESAIPAVTVLEVVSGDEFALGSLVPSDRPLLVWFWAPH